MLKILGFIATALLVPVLLILLVEWSPRIAHQLLKWAAGRLGDKATAARYLEEWQGDLRDTPNGLSQLFYAISRVFRLPLMARELNVTLALRSRLRAARRDHADTAGSARTRYRPLASRRFWIDLAAALSMLGTIFLTLWEVLSEQVSLIVMSLICALLLTWLVYLRVTGRRIRQRALRRSEMLSVLRSQIHKESEMLPSGTLVAATQAALEELKERHDVGNMDVRISSMGFNVNLVDTDRAADVLPLLRSGHIYLPMPEHGRGHRGLIDNTTPSAED